MGNTRHSGKQSSSLQEPNTITRVCRPGARAGKAWVVCSMHSHLQPSGGGHRTRVNSQQPTGQGLKATKGCLRQRDLQGEQHSQRPQQRSKYWWPKRRRPNQCAATRGPWGCPEPFGVPGSKRKNESKRFSSFLEMKIISISLG